MTNQHWRAARATRFANTAGATGTAPSPKGVNGPKGPGSCWKDEDLCALLDGLNTRQYRGVLTQHSDRVICQVIGRSPRTYAKLSRYANWDAGRKQPTHTVFTHSTALIDSLSEDPQDGRVLLDPAQALQAIRRTYDKKKLTFMDEQTLLAIRNAIHRHRRYLANPRMEYDD